jgi:glyceraldehyde 3-phosphate dehydrogenase
MNFMSDIDLKKVKKEISSDKKVRIAINGFGRIGRMILRIAYHNPDVEIVAINDLSDIKACAYYFKHDSTHGTFDAPVSYEGNYLIVGDKKIKVLQERFVNNLPWGELDVDVVCECTGMFTKVADARVHLKQGAKKMLLSAPAKGDCFYFVRGVNDSDYDNQDIVSNGSCTTNSISSVVNEINKKFGIKKGMFATIHSVTGDQRILDSTHSNLRRGRAAPFNIVPTTTGAANAVIKLIPELEGKLHGIAYRVPTIDGSVTDLNLELKKDVTKDELNEFLKKLCSNRLNGVMEYSVEELVSSDIIGNPHSGIIDSLSTEVVGGNLVKIVIWYDNEWGFSTRMVEVMKAISKN